jgi:hypothetical protein
MDEPAPETTAVTPASPAPPVPAVGKPKPVNPRPQHHHQRVYYVTGTIKPSAANTSAPVPTPTKPKPKANSTRTSSLDPAARPDIES